MNRVIEKVMASGDEPSVVGATVLKVAIAAVPRLRYTSGGLAARLRLLRRFAPARLMDAGLRKDLQLDARQAIA
jgi:hypothetical protein